MMNHLIWFREDLRIGDNTALYHACKEASHAVIALYFLTPNTWKMHDMAACRVDFILRGLQKLSKDLQQYHIPLQIITINDDLEIPTTLLQLCQQHHIKQVYLNRQYEVNEEKRDVLVKTALAKENIAVKMYHDQCILPPETVKTAAGHFYTVFTPYKKSWQLALNQLDVNCLPTPPIAKKIDLNPSAVPLHLPEFSSQIPHDIWPAGEMAASKRLNDFLAHGIIYYHKNRDYPAVDGTSKLSPYLASGMISSRECWLAAQRGLLSALEKEGIETWINELIWREFYRHVLVGFPRVSKNKPFKLTMDRLPWCNDDSLLLAWQQGKTGYPLVDAAMRQLNTTGWMHNRLRMLVAMVLSKLMLIDWRRGEKYFMQHLIDGDLASNNGGWQWSASTGTDAVPYFRIFNPYSQSQKFDPQGEFIRQYCPELAKLDNQAIHQPYAFLPKNSPALDYPKPVFDYAQARAHALLVYKQV